MTRGSLRVVGGAWRGRRVAIPEHPGLRPTPDRVRETLFNWLAPQVAGARCLDAYAGTGALGLEALSRGAASCVFIESDAALARAIEAAARTLGAAVTVLRGASPLAWRDLEGRFDLVFLDPPFNGDGLTQALAALPPYLAPGHRVYLEYAAAAPPALPAGWRLLKAKRAGAVGYALARAPAAGQDGCP